MEHDRHFSEKFYRDGFAKGCAECTYFLAVSLLCLMVKLNMFYTGTKKFICKLYLCRYFIWI